MTGNIQYLRTDRAIQSAFLTLLSKKPFEKITVQDILDTTPVSRATFYKHYHDKFEIAERIQDEVLTSLRELWDTADVQQFESLLELFVHRYNEMCRLLMKVRTDRVNLAAALDQEARNHYLKNSESPTRDLEAKIYGAAMGAFILDRIEEKDAMTMDQAYTVMVPVALRLMGMPQDPDFRQMAVRYK